MSALEVLSREGCGLCQEMVAELSVYAAREGCSLTVTDVDRDPLMARRYGLKVPVLFLDGEMVCLGVLDWDALAAHRRATRRADDPTRLV